MVRHLPANVGDIRDMGLIPGSGRSPGGGNGTHSSILSWEIPRTEEPGGAREYQANERAGVTRLSWRVSGRLAGRCRAAQLASIRQMSGQVSRGSAGEYQAD